MKSNISYKQSVAGDLKNIDPHQRGRILSKIESQLTQDPAAGKRLTGEYAGLFSLRIGDYRVIYSIIKDDVLILRIRHRKESYR